MRISLRLAALVTAGFAGVLLTPALSSAQSCSGGWKCGVSYGANTIMDLYVPTKVDAAPGIVVSIHYCSGNAGSAHGWFQSAADKYGFIIIAPGAGGNCFDAKPERSGERENITKMVQYVVTQNHADPKRVFAAGASSGACMTQALMAAYPDVFAAGSSLAGVPAGAWTGGNAFGVSTGSKTDAQWGDIVRSADSGFSGTRPRLQLWHGGMDETLKDETFWPPEQGQWKNVAGVTDADGTKSQFKASQDTWERTSYKDAGGTVVVETNFAPNAPHDLSGRGLWDDVVRFFGLDMDAPTGTGGGGAGGTSGTGGAATGGAAPSGGTANGGTAGSAPSSTAGAATGGTSSAGAPSSGGSPNGTAGQPASGGAPSGSGNTGTGAQTSKAGTGNNTGSPGAGGGSSSDDDGGCSIAHVGGGSGSALAAVAMAGLGVLLGRRRRRA
jgi:poly(hydroxyalkanoate) depolymerase family esterase